MLGQRAEMRVAGGEFREGVADADHRPAVEDIRRQAFILHPAAVHEGILALPPNHSADRNFRGQLAILVSAALDQARDQGLRSVFLFGITKLCFALPRLVRPSGGGSQSTMEDEQ